MTIVEENQAVPQRLENTKYNPELLSLIFKQFTDLVLLQWEEAADLLIDEILTEEILYLNSLNVEEIEEKPLQINKLDDLVSEISRIQDFEQTMKNKYL